MAGVTEKAETISVTHTPKEVLDRSFDSANNRLKVVVESGGGAGTEYNVNDAAPADPVGTPFLMERDDALSALAEVEGDWTNPRSDAQGAMWTRDAAVNAVTNGSVMRADIIS